MKRLAAWLAALVAFVLHRRERKAPDDGERIVASTAPDRRAELVVIALALCSALCAAGFIVIYAWEGLGHRTQLLGIAIALCFAFAAVALVVFAQRLLAYEELEEDYPEPEHLYEQRAIDEIVHQSGDALTRKRLLLAAGGFAGAAMGAAALAPVLSLGPWTNTDSLYDTPWRAGRRLVDEHGRALRAADIETSTFYTAFPEDAPHDEIGSPLVIVRLDPAALALPPARALWAPGGILAYSKICTHAGCAISLYRAPLFADAEPKPALVCPCHYSTFDPSDGGSVQFGPAGRDLPQLPLRIDAAGHLRAAGNFSGPVGPSWQGVRGEHPT